MGAHMKNTIELSDPLFKSAKQLAKQSRTTLRALVEEGLRRVLAESPAKAPSAFKLQNASVHGKAMLITDPRQWQAMEAEHVAARARLIPELNPTINLALNPAYLCTCIPSMIAVDTNILVYAHRAESVFHHAALRQYPKLG